jgi:N-acyl-D-amino-acid deacylase
VSECVSHRSRLARGGRLALAIPALLLAVSCAPPPGGTPTSTPSPAPGPPPAAQTPSAEILGAETPTAGQPADDTLREDPDFDAYDFLLVGGSIVDGTGNGWFRGDVAIREDRIVAVEPSGVLDRGRSEEVVDVSGLVVAPGFLDINGQSDMSLFGDGRALNKIFQGVTTEIMGENSTPAPRNRRVTGPVDPSDTTATRRAEAWARFGGWLEELEASGVTVNVASFVGAATVRQYAMGMADRDPTPAELDTMRAVVRRSVEDGALGVASGLIYPPGAFSSTAELIALAEASAAAGGIYISHIRSESDRLLEAIDEAVRIGAASGAPVELYHLKAAGVENWALAEASWAKIDSARAAGVDISASMYPYTAASTSLTACLPPWIQADGRLYENLDDPDIRARVLAEIDSGSGGWENWCDLATPTGSMIVGLGQDSLKHLQGTRLADLAAAKAVPWPVAAMDLLRADSSRVGMVFFAMDEDNVRNQLRLPWIKFGSDSGSWDPSTARSMTHPRSYGTYPRILGRYVRDEGALELEEAIRKMTSAVADRVGLRDRGQVRAGFMADIVVLDMALVRETATFTDPHRLAEGVVHLLVNGRPVILNGGLTGLVPGRFLRGPGTR